MIPLKYVNDLAQQLDRTIELFLQEHTNLDPTEVIVAISLVLSKAVQIVQRGDED